MQQHFSYSLDDMYISQHVTARKTASRWDETTKLTQKSFFGATQQPPSIIVDWLQGTKASRTDPHRASRFAVIVGDMTEKTSSLWSRRSHPAPRLQKHQRQTLRTRTVAHC